MNADFIDTLRQIEREKDIPFQTLLETIEQALVSAYRRTHQDAAADVRLRPDPRTRGMRIVLSKMVVDSVTDPHLEISVSEAQRKNPNARLGEALDVELNSEFFGRIAAQTAKQVVVQRIREAEREKVFGDFQNRVGEVTTGVVQRREQRNVIVLLGKVEALLPASEQAPGDGYRFNDRIKVYLLEVRKTAKGPQVIVSRSHPSLIRRLFELEVPEISEGVVQIRNVAREAGHRSKIAVSSSDEKVDPVGACVGHRGSRVQAVVNELYGEKIDIIPFKESDEEFIRESMSPAKPVSVTLNTELHSAYVVVPDSQLSLAIGKEGQNVRLAARLTSWRIDIRSETQDQERRQQEQTLREQTRRADLELDVVDDLGLETVNQYAAVESDTDGNPA